MQNRIFQSQIPNISLKRRSVLPIALLFAESSMNNLQSVSIVAAFPIGAVIVMIAVSFMKDAKKYMEELGNKK